MDESKQMLLKHQDDALLKNIYGDNKLEESKILDDIKSKNNVTLTWKDVNVNFTAFKKRTLKERIMRVQQPPPMTKHLLSNSSGLATPGSVLAVLGSSGSGKSVLFNALTGKNIGNLTVTGEIMVNGKVIGRDISKIAAYAQQNDMFVGTLKVKEHLWFQAQLRLSSRLTDEEKMERVLEVMSEMGLTKRADTLIGIPGEIKTLSGGERKRLTFASEIITDPAILFCDEPTTGLDAFMAQQVVDILQNMANKGKTVLCTIHQPSSEVYTMFDNVLYLANGHTAFMGRINEALEFMDQCGYTCPMKFNPADYIIHTLAPVPGKEAEQAKVIEEVTSSYRVSIYSEDISNSIAAANKLGFMDQSGDSSIFTNDVEPSGYKSTMATQMKLLLWRSWLGNTRNKRLVRSLYIQNVMVSLLLGLIYIDNNYNQAGIQNINGALYIMQIQGAFSNMYMIVNTFPLEYPLFRRERGNNMYSTGAYFVTHCLAEWPFFFTIPLVYIGICYYMVGLYPAFGTFVYTLLVGVLISFYSVGLSHLIATATVSVSLANNVMPTLRNIITIFGGFFLNTLSVPYFLYPLQWLSVTYYSNELLVINQWRNVDVIACGKLVDADRCLRSGDEVIDSFNFSYDRIPLDFCMLVFYYGFFEFLAYFILCRRTRKL